MDDMLAHLRDSWEQFERDPTGMPEHDERFSNALEVDFAADQQRIREGGLGVSDQGQMAHVAVETAKSVASLIVSEIRKCTTIGELTQLIDYLDDWQGGKE